MAFLLLLLYLLTKEDAKSELLNKPECDKLGRIKLQFHIVNNIHNDSTLEHICKEVCKGKGKGINLI